MNILNYETVELDDEKNCIRIIDQTCLPCETKILELTGAEEMWDAIYLLKVRGAPAIGVFAAFAIYLLAKKLPDDLSYEDFYAQFKKDKDYLDSSRPTAVNLSWALNRMERVVTGSSVSVASCESAGDGSKAAAQAAAGTKSVSGLKELLRIEAIKIKDEDTAMCRAIGEYGLSLLKPGDGILTHCNAGQLATSKYGTATAPIYLGHEKNYNFRVFCDETRPLLQGARLTSYELSSVGIDVTLICDNMAASVMKEGRVNAVLVGCDRVAANGDAANKIGTLGVAILAKRYNIPFYVCAPGSTIDMNIKSGAEIVIEQRKAEEVTEMWYEKRMAPENVRVYNPAFDVTDNELITAIITEKGIARAPYTDSLAALMK